MRAKIKTAKYPLGFKKKKKKKKNLTSQKSQAKFPSHKNFQKVLNDITQKIET